MPSDSVLLKLAAERRKKRAKGAGAPKRRRARKKAPNTAAVESKLLPVLLRLLAHGKGSRAKAPRAKAPKARATARRMRKIRGGAKRREPTARPAKGLRSLPDAFLKRIAAAKGPKAPAARAELARRARA